ncbi:HAD-IB family hydrolase [Sphingorhabdus sp. EL138]|jgi:HAD superfamily hydrolase (TIGR01490 family)|uniref:HAD family hydrolase n=1 Tax=Sphingorhabdus sp. EL138 TaxID=2073156 RepID=UPI0025D0E510|nr:HAD-IB family hydrolase [Sphingorhabdus sp. EL138]
MNKPQTTLLAIYDMDKTVTRRATYNGFLLHMALHKSPWRLLLAPFLPVGLALYALKIWDRAQLKQFSQILLIGRRVPKAQFAKYLESHADMVVGKNVYPQLLARVAQEKAAGYRHVMATASYRLYVEAIAKRLGFDDVIATDLSTDSSGHVLARIDGHNCYDAAKLELVKRWMERHGLERGTCHIRAYSDHVSDAPLLNYADEPFATNPHGPLARLAEKKGWRILDWRVAET